MLHQLHWSGWGVRCIHPTALATASQTSMCLGL